MQFKLPFLAILAAAATPALAKTCTASEVTSALEEVEATAGKTASTAGSITHVNFMSTVVGLIQGKKSTVDQINKIVECDIGPLTEEEQKEICKTYKQVLTTEADSQKAVLNNANTINNLPFVEPLSAVTRGVEGQFDTLSHKLVDVVPKCASSFADAEKGLNQALEKTLGQLGPQ